MSRAQRGGKKIVARNRRAFHEYEILDTWEAGIVLTGPEVKSIRAGRVSIAEALARVGDGEVWLYGMHISPYDPASRWNLNPLRTRKLLLNARMIMRLISAIRQRWITIVTIEVAY